MKKAKTVYEFPDVLSSVFSTFESWDCVDDNPCEAVFYKVTLARDLGDFQKNEQIPAVLVSFFEGYFELCLTDDTDSSDPEDFQRFSLTYKNPKVEEMEMEDEDEDSEDEDDEDSEDEDEDEDW